MSFFISLSVHLPFVADLNLKPVRKRIYNGSSYTVKSTGYLVSSTAEFTAGMKHGKYNLYRRESRFVVDPYRNTTSIIYNRN